MTWLKCDLHHCTILQFVLTHLCLCKSIHKCLSEIFVNKKRNKFCLPKGF